MIGSCQSCGEPAALDDNHGPVCETCAARFAEYDRHRAAADAGVVQWNESLHDPFWRDWLESWELFAIACTMAPRIGRHIHSVAGGDIFECFREECECWLQVWVSDCEALIAYAPFAERYGLQGLAESPHEFEAWAGHLRASPPLELGSVRDRCSYGAVSTGVGRPPMVKWAQAGDWAAMIRNWHKGEGDGRGTRG